MAMPAAQKRTKSVERYVTEQARALRALRLIQRAGPGWPKLVKCLGTLGGMEGWRDCGRTFKSTGPDNRLCEPCRTRLGHPSFTIKKAPSRTKNLARAAKHRQQWVDEHEDA